MALAIGTPVASNITGTTALITTPAATGGTPPYTYQLYRSTVTGFTPGAGNLIPGATSLSYQDSGLDPNTTFYYVMIVTDSVAATASSAEATAVTTPQTLQQNVQNMSPMLGVLDQAINPNVREMMIDSSQVTPLFPGSAVKFANTTSKIPTVVGCTADNDACIGFLAWDYQHQQFNGVVPGAFASNDRCTVAMNDSVMYLYATSPIDQGAQVCLDVLATGGVQPTGSAATVVGWAYDKAVTPGGLIRVTLTSPSFLVA